MDNSNKHTLRIAWAAGQFWDEDNTDQEQADAYDALFLELAQRLLTEESTLEDLSFEVVLGPGSAFTIWEIDGLFNSRGIEEYVSFEDEEWKIEEIDAILTRVSRSIEEMLPYGVPAESIKKVFSQLKGDS